MLPLLSEPIKKGVCINASRKEDIAYIYRRKPGHFATTKCELYNYALSRLRLHVDIIIIMMASPVKICAYHAIFDLNELRYVNDVEIKNAFEKEMARLPA